MLLYMLSTPGQRLGWGIGPMWWLLLLTFTFNVIVTEGNLSCGQVKHRARLKGSVLQDIPKMHDSYKSNPSQPPLMIYYKLVSVPSACIFLFSLLCSGFCWVSIFWQWVCSPWKVTVWGQENVATRLHYCLCLSFCSQPVIKSKKYVCLFDWGWNWATDKHRADKQKSRQDQVSTSATFTPNLEDFVEALALADLKHNCCETIRK